jgi:hypothetical protein
MKYGQDGSQRFIPENRASRIAVVVEANEKRNIKTGPHAIVNIFSAMTPLPTTYKEQRLIPFVNDVKQP